MIERLQNLPLHRKLTAIIVVTTVAAIFLSSIATVVYEVYTFRSLMTSELETTADVIGANGRAAPAKAKAKESSRCPTGTLSIIARGVPWALVSVDGRKLVGETPMRGIKIKTGVRKLKIWHPGSGKQKTLPYRVEGCAKNTLRVSLN